MRVIYSDGTELKLCGQDTAQADSDYIRNYIATDMQLSARRAWKSSGYGARFRGEATELPEERRIDAFINSVGLTAPQRAFYTFSVNEVSGLYKKDFAAEKCPETHVIHSQNTEFTSSCHCPGTDLCAVTVRSDTLTGHIAELDLTCGDYRVLTGGDCYDSNPSFSAKADRILYDSAGVGRDHSGNFAAYSDRSLYAFNRADGRVDELLAKPGRSLIKPKEDAEGNLYFIEKPTFYKAKRSNSFSISC